MAFYIIGCPFGRVAFIGINRSSISYIIKCRLCCFFFIVVIGIFDIGIEGIGKMAIQNDVGDFLVYRFTDSSISTLIEQIGPVTEAAPLIESAPYPDDGPQPTAFYISLENGDPTKIEAQKNADGNAILRWDAGSSADVKAKRLKVMAEADGVKSPYSETYFLYCYYASETYKHCVLAPIKTVKK